jgi:DNA-binding sugar fermentation-stimulating protein
MRKLVDWVDSTEKDNIIFLGTHRSNRVFRQIIANCGIQNLNVYNISSLEIPVEQIGFPYYFMLDSACRISNVFIPDKVVPLLCDSYLMNIKERYFLQK